MDSTATRVGCETDVSVHTCVTTQQPCVTRCQCIPHYAPKCCRFRNQRSGAACAKSHARRFRVHTHKSNAPKKTYKTRKSSCEDCIQVSSKSPHLSGCIATAVTGLKRASEASGAAGAVTVAACTNPSTARIVNAPLASPVTNQSPSEVHCGVARWCTHTQTNQNLS